MCFERHRPSITSVILSGTNLFHCHLIQEPATRAYISTSADAPHVAYRLGASDPNGQPTIPPSKTTSCTAITWKIPPRDLLTPQELSLNLTPADIDQNVINDCSFCASVAICIQHNQRFNSRVCFLLICPPLLEVVQRSRPKSCFSPASSHTKSLYLLFLSTSCVQPPATVKMTHILMPVSLSANLFSKLLSSSLLPGNQPGRYDLKVYLNGDCRRVCRALPNQWTIAVTRGSNLLMHFTDM